MDLYEALKSGTSEEELLKAFHKDLDAANARIAAEQETTANKELTDCRKSLAEAIIKYTKALLGEKDLDESLSAESIVETLKEFEKEMKQTVTFSKKLDKIFEKTKSKNGKPAGIEVTAHSDNDDDYIIAQFIKSLK